MRRSKIAITCLISLSAWCVFAGPKTPELSFSLKDGKFAADKLTDLTQLDPSLTWSTDGSSKWCDYEVRAKMGLLNFSVV